MASIREVTIPYLKQVRDFLDLELANFKVLEGSNRAQVLSSFGLGELVGDLYYNDLNLIFTAPQDWDNFKHIITSPEIIFKLEIPEFKQFLIVVRYTNDVLLEQILPK
jgi:hypothetical protein